MQGLTRSFVYGIMNIIGVWQRVLSAAFMVNTITGSFKGKCGEEL